MNWTHIAGSLVLGIAIIISCGGCNRSAANQQELQARFEVLDLFYLEVLEQLHQKHFQFSPTAAQRELERAQYEAAHVTIDDFNAVKKIRRADALLMHLLQTKLEINNELEQQLSPRAKAFKKDLNDSEIIQEYLAVRQQLEAQ